MEGLTTWCLAFPSPYGPNRTSPSTSPSPILLGHTAGRTRQEGRIQSNMRRRHQMVQGCGHDPYRFGGADLLSHPGAHGGLDARLGASLVPRADVNSRNHREEPAGRVCAPVRCPQIRGGDAALPRLGCRGSAVAVGKKIVTTPGAPPRGFPRPGAGSPCGCRWWRTGGWPRCRRPRSRPWTGAPRHRSPSSAAPGDRR